MKKEVEGDEEVGPCRCSRRALEPLHLDGGHEAAQRVVLDLFQVKLSAPLTALVKEDYKSRLQELTQRSFKETPNYEVVKVDQIKASFVVAELRGS